MIMEIFWFVVARVLALVLGCFVMLDILRKTIQHGYRTVWGSKTWARPACLDDPDLGSHSFIKVNDVRIHYVASGPEDKPLMLFLHGFPEFWFSWRHQIKEFQKDFRVVAIDQRGFGDSDKPQGVESYKETKLLADIREVISGLDYKSCVLVAHDFGGANAWAFASHFPDMVDKLVVMNAPSQKSYELVLKKKSWVPMCFFHLPLLPELNFKLSQFDVFNKIAESFKHEISEDELDAYKYTFSQPGALTPPHNWYRAKLDGQLTYDMNYQMPVLLIWGVKDTYLPIDLLTCMEELFPQMEVRRIAEGGHFVQGDNPSEVNQIMREWLAKTG